MQKCNVTSSGTVVGWNQLAVVIHHLHDSTNRCCNALISKFHSFDGMKVKAVTPSTLALNPIKWHQLLHLFCIIRGQEQEAVTIFQILTYWLRCSMMLPHHRDVSDMLCCTAPTIGFQNLATVLITYGHCTHSVCLKLCAAQAGCAQGTSSTCSCQL